MQGGMVFYQNKRKYPSRNILTCSEWAMIVLGRMGSKNENHI
jgi:hypothetical protein